MRWFSSLVHVGYIPHCHRKDLVLNETDIRAVLCQQIPATTPTVIIGLILTYLPTCDNCKGWLNLQIGEFYTACFVPLRFFASDFCKPGKFVKTACLACLSYFVVSDCNLSIAEYSVRMLWLTGWTETSLSFINRLHYIGRHSRSLIIQNNDGLAMVGVIVPRNTLYHKDLSGHAQFPSSAELTNHHFLKQFIHRPIKFTQVQLQVCWTNNPHDSIPWLELLPYQSKCTLPLLPLLSGE